LGLHWQLPEVISLPEPEGDDDPSKAAPSGNAAHWAISNVHGCGSMHRIQSSHKAWVAAERAASPVVMRVISETVEWSTVVVVVEQPDIEVKVNGPNTSPTANC